MSQIFPSLGCRRRDGDGASPQSKTEVSQTQGSQLPGIELDAEGRPADVWIRVILDVLPRSLDDAARIHIPTCLDPLPPEAEVAHLVCADDPGRGQPIRAAEVQQECQLNSIVTPRAAPVPTLQGCRQGTLRLGRDLGQRRLGFDTP